MTIRSTVKKVDRYGIQGRTSFDPKHPNANIALYRELERFLSGDYGLGGSGGQRANMIKDPRSYQASHVFNSPGERDAVTGRLQQQLEEFYQSKIGEQAKASGMSSDDFLHSQGIQPIQYQPDDFILASQNPLRGSAEKKIKAFMNMAGNTQSISGGTGEHRRHTGYYRPNDLKHVRSILSTEARRLNEGRANLGEMEGLYLPASQKLEARTAQSIFKNGLTEDLLNNEKHPVVAKIRSDMLKQHATTQLKAKVKQGLQEEGLLPPDEEKKSKTEKSVTTKAMEAAAIVTTKILNIAGDLKTLFTSAVGYLQNIASEIGGLKQVSATLGITTNQALTEKYLAKMNKVYAADENVFLNAGKAVLDMTADPSRISDIKWDSVVLQGQAGLIRPIIDAAVSGKMNPIETRNKIYNQLAAEYFDPKLSPSARRKLRTKQMVALESLPGGASIANGYQVVTDVAEAYGYGKGNNRFNVMGALYNSVNNDSNRSLMYERFGMTKEIGLGSKENQRKLNDFTKLITAIEEAVKKFTMVHFDDVTRAMQELALALLSFIAFFGNKDSTAAKLKEVIERRIKFEGETDREKLGKNAAIVRLALLNRLKKAGYTGAAAEGIIQEGVDAQNPDEIMKGLLLRKGSTPTFNKYLRDIFILSSKYRNMQKDMLDYDLSKNKTIVNPHNLENEGDKNFDENTTLFKENLDAVQPGEWKKLLKNVGTPTKEQINEKSRAHKEGWIFINGKWYKVMGQLNLDSLMKHTLPSRTLASPGSFLSGGAQDKQTIAVDNTLRLLINNKEITLKNDNSTNDKKNIFYAETRLT